MIQSLMTETALRFQKIHKNQAVLVLSNTPGKPYRGIILTPGKSLSLVRFKQDDEILEKRLKNTILVPVRIKKPTPATTAA
jgi:hypothetical protein